MGASVPVLLYHHVAPDREVTPAEFEAQLDWLADNGFKTLSLAGLLAHTAGERPAPERSVAVTFDDGYADNWVHAWPALKRRDMRAIVFVVTSMVGDASRPRPTSEEGGSTPDTRSDERGPAGWLTWAELAAMSGSGVFEVGSHTHTHRGFERGRTWQDLAGELARSRELIEARLGSWCGALAWPWGDAEPGGRDVLLRSGYRAAFTAKPGPNPPGRDPFELRRFKVSRGGAGWLSRRVWLYRQGLLAESYGALHGLDRRIKGSLRIE